MEQTVCWLQYIACIININKVMDYGFLVQLPMWRFQAHRVVLFAIGILYAYLKKLQMNLKELLDL